MKAFVITDNTTIFEEFYKIVSSISFLEVDYFCSPSSCEMFAPYLKRNIVSPTKIKENISKLVNNYDIGFSCHSKQIFPREIVENIKCINIHPGFNPYNRGFYPQVFSIINKLPIGATIHIMDEKIDSGPIIKQERVKIESYDTSLSLYEKIVKKEIILLKRNIIPILTNREVTTVPSFDGNYNSKEDFRNLCQINLCRKMKIVEIIDYLRALTHPPYNNAYFLDKDGTKRYISITLSKFDDYTILKNNFKYFYEVDISKEAEMKDTIDNFNFLTNSSCGTFFLDNCNIKIYISLKLTKENLLEKK
jgi:dTDP-4-amino-4,6-dideoxyglucose formyltransferase